MSLSTPTLATISTNVLSQIEASISQTIPLLPKAFARVLAKAIAAVFVLLYRYAGFIFLQLFVATASMRETVVNGRTIQPLLEWGRLIGVGDPAAATRAELTVTVTVDVQTGSLPAGSQLLFASTGVIYLTVASVALDAATVQVTVRASSDQDGGGGAGVIGNLDPGDILSFASPLPNVARDAVVVSQVVTGADGETTEAYRTRVIRKWQRPPQGGAYADYRGWGEEEAGIVNIYPYTSASPGEVIVYVEATVASSGSADGIPTGPQLTAVSDLIQLDDNGLASRRPAGAGVVVQAITRTAFDTTITGLAADDLPAAKTAIEAATDEYLRARAPFIVGLSVLPRRDRVTRAAVSGVADEAASAIGASFSTLTLFLSAVEKDAYTLQDGEKAKFGAPTYT